MAMRRGHEYQIECIIVGDRRNRGDFAVRAFNAKIVFNLYNRDVASTGHTHAADGDMPQKRLRCGDAGDFAGN